MVKAWEVVKAVFLACVIGALLYAVAYGQTLPPELDEVKTAIVLNAGTCTNAATGERAICILAVSEDGKYAYLLVLNPDESVRECFRKTEGEQAVRIWPRSVCNAMQKCS